MILNKVLAVVILALFSAPAVSTTAQQTDDTIALTVRLRAADGTAVAGETVSLQRLPDAVDIAPPCRTDMLGACTWYVERGLYQVLFARPLDKVSVLALAEGGLRGFGLTVGEAPLTYDFTFHSDGHVYFDAAPDAATPVPIIPTAEHLHGGAEATAMPEATVIATATAEPQLVAAGSGESDEGVDDTTSDPEAHATAIDGRWRVLILAATGLMAGSALYWWTRRRTQKETSRRRDARPSHDGPVIEEQDHA